MIKLVRTFILGLATAAFLTGAVSAQTTTNEGAFDALSTGNQKIVNAIHDAQIETSTLSTDDIAAKKLDGSYGGWGKIYQQMYADGLVEFKNLGQAVSSYHHANKPPPPPSPSTTVITTASGQKIIVGGSKPGHFGKSQSNSAKSNGGKKSFTPGKGASVTITTAGGGTHGGAVSGSAKHGGGSSVGITSAGGGGGHGYGKAKSGKGK